MKEHIDILQLFDYAQGKISDEEQLDRITDHLCICEFCQQILKSHYYLIQNHDILLERFFPETEPAAQIATNKTIKRIDIQFSPALIIQSLSDKIMAFKKQGSIISKDIKAEILRFLAEIKSLSNLEEALVPLKVENIALLGVEETKKRKEKELKYLSRNIRLRFLPLQFYKMEDFSYRFTGKFFYVIYEKKNFKVLKDRKVNLTTDLGPPFIFTTTFKETHNSVIASFKIEFEEILPVEDSTTSKDDYLEFFLTLQ